MNKDVAIIGGGAAGLSSLIWCNSLGLEAVLFEASSELGGQMPRMYHRVIDYPGLLPGNGTELRDRFVEHVDRLNLIRNCLLKDTVVAIIGSSSEFLVRSVSQEIAATAVILAMGARVRQLEVPGAREFEGNGVSFSATRDHPLVAGKNVVVVGGGDSAVENSLILARVCRHVYLIHRSDRFRAREEWLTEARNNDRITVMSNSHVTAINGNSSITHVDIRDNLTGITKTIPAEGVFVRIGMAPNSELVSLLLRLDSDGFVEVDSHQQTSVEMIYAAGDICGAVNRSVSAAAGHGAIAAKHIARKLNRMAIIP